MDQNPKKGGEG